MEEGSGKDCVRQAFKDAGAKKTQEIPAPVKRRDLPEIAEARGWQRVSPDELERDEPGIVVHDQPGTDEAHAEYSYPVRVLIDDLGIVGRGIFDVFQRKKKRKK
jgi:hypothetical protein